MYSKSPCVNYHESHVYVLLNQSPRGVLFFPLLSRSRMCVAARIVPAPPAQPLCLSHLTSDGVSHAVSPTRTGRNSVLWTVYASSSIAYRPSCPPFVGAASSSSRPGSGGFEGINPSANSFTDNVSRSRYSAPMIFMRPNDTPKSSTLKTK